MSTHLIQTETPGGIEENDDTYLEGNIDDELVIWLKKNAISSDGIKKICKTLSFKRIQTLSKHERSLSKLSADALNLSLMDKIGFLDGIEDLRKQNSPHLKHVIANPNILNPLNEQELHKTQLIQNYICTLDNNYKTQKQNINKAFMDIISTINAKKSEMENMLKQTYTHNKHKLNTQLYSNDINEFDKLCELTFSMNYDHKTDIIQSIASIGNINGIYTNIHMPILNIKNITSNCIDININDEDIDILNKESIFKYEIQFSKAPINVDNEMNDEKDMNDVIWATQVIHSDKKSFSLQNLESNRSYLIRMKKTHICNNQSIITDLMRGHTLLNYDKILYKKLIELKLQNVSNNDMLIAAQQFNDVNDAVNYLLCCNNYNNEEIDEIDNKQEIIDNDELKNDIQLLCWDKIRHGLNVNFLNDYCVQTGEFCLVICADGIAGKMFRDFIWEITIDRLSTDSTFIGYINGPITNINLNSCLTAGKQNSKTQFAVAFNNGFDEGTLFGIDAKKRKIKLKSAARKGDRFMFHVNFEKKEVVLYQNDKRVGVIFTNVSHNIVPAVSGRGGKYTIKTIYDLSVIEEPKSNGGSWWPWTRK
eukprot:269124_1